MINKSIEQITQEINSQVDIVEIIGRYINLTKKGRNYTGLCPFHDDKKLGNFYVSQEKQIFSCFSCNTKGGVIKFVQEYERIGFIEAVKKICEIANISIDGLDDYGSTKQINPKLEEAYKCLNEINNFYKASLSQNVEGNHAREYLESRGLTEEIIKFFDIGYAQKGDNLKKYLEAKGFSLHQMDLCGIISLSSNVLTDSNAGRIIFPIKNENGQVVGFSARIFGDMVSDSKYINTRETIAFKKANILYNYHNAMPATRKVGHIYLLEGFMDVIAAYRVDIKNAICLMGTALTKEQVTLLKRLNSEVRVCLDRDEPGQQNTLRTIDFLEKNQIPYKIVDNTQNVKGKDADEILKNEGPEALKKYFNTLTSRAEWTLKYYSRNLDLTNLNDRKTLINSYLPELANFKNNLDVEDMIKKLASLTNFSIETLKLSLEEYKKKSSRVKAKPDSTYSVQDLEKAESYYKPQTSLQNKKRSKIENLERTLLAYFVTNKEAYDDYKEEFGFFDTAAFKNIYNYIEEYVVDEYSKTNDFSTDDIKDYILRNESDDKQKELYIKEIDGIQADMKKKIITPYTKEEIEFVLGELNKYKEEKSKKENRSKSMKLKDKDEIPKLLENESNKLRRKLEKEEEK